MKSRVLFLLAVLLIVMALASCSVASSNKEPNDNDINSGKPEAIDSQASKGIEYTLLDDGTYEVSGIGYCIDTHIVISRTYQGKPVTSIGERAFDYCTSLTSITIPDSVTSIGDYAFDGCKSLESITVEEGNTVYHSSGNCLIETTSKTLVLGCKTSAIPTDGSVTSIGSSTFSICTSLESITIPDSVTSIGIYAFYNCTSLESITIPDSVTSIGKYAFLGCSSLTSITIPDSVTSIGDEAFSFCSSLTSITIPDGVTSIGSWAFEGCTSLTSITIPDSVTSIGNGAFDGCSSLTSITFNGTKEEWGAIEKYKDWDYNTGDYTIHCTDGDIEK